MSEREVDGFDEIAGDALAASQAEMFDEATGTAPAVERDLDGDKSLESTGDGLEGRGEEEDEGEAEPQPEGEGQVRGEDGKFRPKEQPSGDRHEAGLRGEIRSTRDRLAAERERAGSIEQQFADYRRETEAKLTEMQRQIQQGQQPRQDASQQDRRQADPVVPADKEPDMYLDPEAWRAWNGREMDRRVAVAMDQVDNQRMARSFASSHQQHGDAFAAAFQAANSLDSRHPDAQAVLASFKAAPDPGAALMAWHGRQAAMRDIGTDPAAYRARIEAETRDKLAKDPEFLRTIAAGMQGSEQGRGARDIDLPTSLKSLNGARGGQGRNGSSVLGLDDQRGQFAEVTRGMN